MFLLQISKNVNLLSKCFEYSRWFVYYNTHLIILNIWWLTTELAVTTNEHLNLLNTVVVESKF